MGALAPACTLTAAAPLPAPQVRDDAFFRRVARLPPFAARAGCLTREGVAWAFRTEEKRQRQAAAAAAADSAPVAPVVVPAPAPAPSPPPTSPPSALLRSAAAQAAEASSAALQALAALPARAQPSVTPLADADAAFDEPDGECFIRGRFYASSRMDDSEMAVHIE